MFSQFKYITIALLLSFIHLLNLIHYHYTVIVNISYCHLLMFLKTTVIVIIVKKHSSCTFNWFKTNLYPYNHCVYKIFPSCQNCELYPPLLPYAFLIKVIPTGHMHKKYKKGDVGIWNTTLPNTQFWPKHGPIHKWMDQSVSRPMK